MKLILSDCSLPIRIPEEKEVKWIDLSALNISNCVGCFGCWTKTPGRCVIRDDATRVYPLIAASDSVLYVSRIKYGGYGQYILGKPANGLGNRAIYQPAAS